MTKYLDKLMVSFSGLISLFFIAPVVIYKIANKPGSAEEILFVFHLIFIWINIILLANLRFRAFFTSYKAFIINNFLAATTIILYLAVNISDTILTILNSNQAEIKNVMVILGILFLIHIFALTKIINKLFIIKNYKKTPCEFNSLGYFFQNKKKSLIYYFDGKSGKWSKSNAEEITSPPTYALLNFCLEKIEKSENINLPLPADKIKSNSPYKTILDYCLDADYQLSEDQTILKFKK